MQFTDPFRPRGTSTLTPSITQTNPSGLSHRRRSSLESLSSLESIMEEEACPTPSIYVSAPSSALPSPHNAKPRSPHQMTYILPSLDSTLKPPSNGNSYRRKESEMAYTDLAAQLAALPPFEEWANQHRRASSVTSFYDRQFHNRSFSQASSMCSRASSLGSLFSSVSDSACSRRPSCYSVVDYQEEQSIAQGQLLDVVEPREDIRGWWGVHEVATVQ